MKTTGVVRKIDQLGRIVIPKELRKSLSIKEGDGVEFLLEEDTIVLRKASSFNGLQNLADSLVNGVYSVTKKNLLITDLNAVISCNDKVESSYKNKPLVPSYLKLLEKREVFTTTEASSLSIVREQEKEKYYCLMPLVVSGELIGSVFLFSENEPINELDKFILKFILYFFEKNIEV